jgi:hypothetical protein
MNKLLSLDLDTPSGTEKPKRRHEGRFPLDHRGEIKIIDKDGRLLIEEVTLEDWSDEGCRFVCSIPLKAGDFVAIRPMEKDENAPDDREPHLFEVTWTNRRIAFWVAGAIRLQGEKLAALKFPPPDSNPGRTSK